MAVASSDTSTTVALTGALPLEQGGGDRTGGGEPAHHVPEGRRGLAGRPAFGVGGHDRGDTAPGPERGGVVAALLGVGPLRALPRAARHDDPRVAGPDVVDVHRQLAPHLGQVVGEVDVGALDQLHERLVAIGLGEVDRDRPLAAVGLLHHEVDAAVAAGQQPRRDEPALGIAGHRVLDLDDVGAPVDQDGARRGHEHPAGQLDDLDAVEGSRHAH